MNPFQITMFGLAAVLVLSVAWTPLKEFAKKSLSIIKFSKDVVMLFRKRGDPSPIIISFEKNPQKILPIDNTINGKPILIGAS